jgi:uncharacterized protein (TIGR02594 family)
MMIEQKPYTAQVPVYLLTALGEYGQAEIPGSKSNPRITEYLASTNLPASGRQDETPWCSAFVNWCMLQSGYRGTRSAAARSWLQWGHKVPAPKLGTIVVLWRDDPSSTKGHVGIFIRKEGASLWLLSGNQGNQVSIENYPLARVLDYREP